MESKVKKNYRPFVFMMVSLAVFSLMFALNYIVPLEKSFLIQFDNIQQRSCIWCEILILGLSACYIAKLRKFNELDLIISLVLGFIVPITGFGFIDGITTAVAYYSACQIFRFYNQQKIFYLDFTNVAKSFSKGALIAIPFAIVNILVIYTQTHQLLPFEASNILYKASAALAPGISEECIFHFFLLAFVSNLFKGSIPKDKFAQFLTYFVCVVPHCLIHFPTILAQDFVSGIVGILFTSLLFGTPMLWLIKNKNLEMAIGFHWAVDFLRFIFVTWNNGV